MIQIELQIGDKAFRDARAAFGHLGDTLAKGVDGASQEITQALKDTLQLVARKMREMHSNPWNGGVVNPTDMLQSRSGSGLRAIEQSIRVSQNGRIASIRGQIDTGGMAVHETGAVIRAKRAQYLTIPLPAAMDPRGVPLRKRARDWGNTFVARSRRGHLLIFQKSGRNQITPLYLLKESVTLRPRLKMEKTIVGDALPYFEKKAFDALSDYLSKVL